MKLLRSLKLMLIPSLLMSCSVQSPELIPCMCDGSDQTLGILDCMCEPGKKKPVRRVSYIQDKGDERMNPTGDQLNAYAYLHQSRNKYAPIQLEYVDFRIPKGQKYDEFDTKLGNYRFRIFGCRRFDKEVYLNQGRAMQKDMKFFDIFYESMNDYYPVVVDKSNPYYVYSDKAQPEYILTAEINDYFMNVCDEFDWENVKKQNLRNGTSEMTVTWRLMDITKSKVYCKGTTTGYGEMKNSEYKGETLLVERAFADALNKLPEVQCFNPELAKRVKPEVLAAQLAQIDAQEKQRITFKNQYSPELQGVSLLQSCASGDLTNNGGTKATGSISPAEEKIALSIDENSGILGKGREVTGYIDENGNVVIVDESGNSQGSGQYVKGYIDENGNFVIVNSAVEEKGGVNGNGQLISGYIDENGNFVAISSSVEESGKAAGKGKHPIGYIDENGNFTAINSTVAENGGSTGIGNKLVGYINEDGNFVATGMKIDENGGTKGSGKIIAGYIDENGSFIATNSRVDENGGAKASGKSSLGKIDENGGSSARSNKIAGVISSEGKFVSNFIIEEKGGSYFYYAQTEERSGGLSKFSAGQPKGLKALAITDNCREVTVGEDSCTTIKVTKNTITYADDYWIDVPADTTSGITALKNRAAAENMYADAKNNFCIQSVKPYQTMSPENIYKLRTSVVSVENPSGRKGAGLIISDQLILTSADLLDKTKNSFDIKAINGMTYNGSAFRVNPNKNVALILLDEKTKFAPLPLRLNLPEVGKDLYMTLGLLDLDEGENYLDNEGQVIGYRYSEEKGAEIIVNTYVQTQTLGSALIDKNGNITGLSHSGVRAQEGGDLFIPIETALKSLGMNICGVKFTNKRPTAIKAIEKPISTAIDNSTGSKEPKAMSAKERK